jgi:bifunctional non-homologous end joining protein LigD
MAIPEPMLSTRAATWPAQGDWMMEPKWDGFRLLVAIGERARIRAWSRRGASLGDRLGSLLAPLAGAPRGTVFDAELVALSCREGRAVQDFAAVCRATLRGDVAAAGKLHLVAFDLLEGRRR